MLRIFTALSVFVCVFSLPQNVGNRLYFTPQNIRSYGYEAETHTVTTSDGYILEMHRIPFRRYESEGDPSRPVVLLMHGLLSASNAYIALGPEYSISYNMADAGFDVWMGNARGNKLSRRHVTLNPDDNVDHLEFFDYTWEEIGMYDITAMVDYILDLTGRQKLHYVGHSQGGTVFLVLGSMRPEYNDKFATAHLLAGVGYQDYFPNQELSALAFMTDIIYALALLTGNIEMFPPTSADVATTSYNKADYCLGDIKYKAMCDAIGVREFMRDDGSDEIGSSSDAGGGSLKLVAHYGQNIRDRLFRRFSHGSAQNQQLYGSTTPPLYDLSLITANVTMHYTVSDTLLDERDVLAMVNDMPNAVARRVARDSFLHEDFAVAPDVRELVTEFMIESILYAEEQLYDSEESNEAEGDDGSDENDNEDDGNDNEGDENIDEEETNDTNEGGDDTNGSNEDVITVPSPDFSSNLVLSVIVKTYLIMYFTFVVIK